MGQDALDALSPFHQPTSSLGRGPRKIKGTRTSCHYPQKCPRGLGGGIAKDGQAPSITNSGLDPPTTAATRDDIDDEDPPLDLHPASHHLLDANPKNGVHCLPLNLPLTEL